MDDASVRGRASLASLLTQLSAKAQNVARCNRKGCSRDWLCSKDKKPKVDGRRRSVRVLLASVRAAAGTPGP